MNIALLHCHSAISRARDIKFYKLYLYLMQWPGVVALMAIESACIPLPSELIMPLAGWMLIKDQSLPAIYTLVAGAYGALGCTYRLCYRLCCGYVGWASLFGEIWEVYSYISPRLDLADRWFNKHGSWLIFVSRLLPVVRTFISLPAGIARMHFVKFLIYTFLGSFIWCAGLAYGGYQLGEHWEQIRAVMRPFDPLIIAHNHCPYCFLYLPTCKTSKIY